MKTVTEYSANKALNKRSIKINSQDLQDVLQKQKDIESKIFGAASLKEYFEIVKTMFALVKAYVEGEYKQIPWFSIAAIVAALFYIFSPFDLIPDFIPVIGLVDDTLVLAVCLKLVKQDLTNFETWRTAQPKTN